MEVGIDDESVAFYFSIPGGGMMENLFKSAVKGGLRTKSHVMGNLLDAFLFFFGIENGKKCGLNKFHAPFIFVQSKRWKMYLTYCIVLIYVI